MKSNAWVWAALTVVALIPDGTSAQVGPGRSPGARGALERASESSLRGDRPDGAGAYRGTAPEARRGGGPVPGSAPYARATRGSATAADASGQRCRAERPGGPTDPARDDGGARGGDAALSERDGRAAADPHASPDAPLLRAPRGPHGTRPAPAAAWGRAAGARWPGGSRSGTVVVE